VSERNKRLDEEYGGSHPLVDHRATTRGAPRTRGRSWQYSVCHSYHCRPRIKVSPRFTPKHSYHLGIPSPELQSPPTAERHQMTHKRNQPLAPNKTPRYLIPYKTLTKVKAKPSYCPTPPSMPPPPLTLLPACPPPPPPGVVTLAPLFIHPNQLPRLAAFRAASSWPAASCTSLSGRGFEPIITAPPLRALVSRSPLLVVLRGGEEGPEEEEARWSEEAR